MGIDSEPEAVNLARRHAEQAKMAEWIRFEVADSRAFLPSLASEVNHVDFAFLDGDRCWPAVFDASLALDSVERLEVTAARVTVEAIGWLQLG